MMGSGYYCAHCGANVTTAGLPDWGATCPACHEGVCHHCAGGWCSGDLTVVQELADEAGEIKHRSFVRKEAFDHMEAELEQMKERLELAIERNGMLKAALREAHARIAELENGGA